MKLGIMANVNYPLSFEIVELLVLDDGWFGDTPNKKYCFGDWDVE